MNAVVSELVGPEVVELLADASNVNAVEDSAGFTALHFAAQIHRIDSMRILLNHAATVDPLDRWGNTPLMRSISAASRTEATQVAAVALLLEHGANPLHRNSAGASVVELATDHPKILGLLKPSRRKRPSARDGRGD